MHVEALVGKRVSLRTIREDDLAAMEVWYEEAARVAFEDSGLAELRAQAEAKDAGVLAIEQAGKDEPIGLLEYEAMEGWLTVPFIALAKPYRGLGYGSAAVRLLEGWALREGLAQRFRAEIDVRNGLGLYFWLRLGYRPRKASGNDGRDVMTMVRKVETGGQLRPAVSSQSELRHEASGA
jgi:RimJ/RimL family protein N-acetyltransferase